LKREKDVDSQEEEKAAIDSDEDMDKADKADATFKDELDGIKTFLPVKSL
jgi:hypothetical protein